MKTKGEQKMDAKVRNKCPRCGKVNKHVWGDKLTEGQGYFVVICECGESYLQALT